MRLNIDTVFVQIRRFGCSWEMAAVEGQQWCQFRALFLQNRFHQNLIEAEDQEDQEDQRRGSRLLTDLVCRGLFSQREEGSREHLREKIGQKPYQHGAHCVFVSSGSSCWAVVQELLLAVWSDLGVWSKLPSGPVGVFERAAVVFLASVHSWSCWSCVQNLSEIKQNQAKKRSSLRWVPRSSSHDSV